MSFEFNQYFLRFVAYHSVSNRFRTFMLDSECDRMEAGWLLEERRSRLDDLEEEAGFAPRHVPPPPSTGASLWDYVDKHARRSPVFHNFMYSPTDQEMVGKP